MRKDVYEKEYLSNPKYFSDIINFYFFEGRKVIKENELIDVNTDQVKDGIEHFRDVIKVIKKDNNNHYCIIGIENQSKVDKTMPARCMIYDANNIDSQIKGGRVLNAGGRLIPVITLVIYWDGSPWNGPRTLEEMYQDVDESLIKYLPTYRINLIEPYSLNDDDFNKLNEELKHLFKAVSLSNDKIKLNKYILKNKFFEDCPLPTARMINALFGIELDSQIDMYRKENGGVNMREVMKELKEDWKREGLAEGKAKGLAEGKAKGLAEGKAKGLAEGLIEGIVKTTIKFGKDFDLTNEEIISRIVNLSNLSEEEVKEKISEFNA